MEYLKKNLSFLKLALPVCIGGIGATLVTITDILFVASSGVAGELAAVAFISTFYLTIYHTLKGIALSGEILIARKNGAADYAAIGKIMRHVLLIISLIALLTLTAIHLWIKEGLDFLIQDRGILAASISFLWYRSYGLPVGLVSEAILAYFIGIKRTSILGVFMIGKVLTNIILNYVLILGNWGFPPMGIEGAAIASSLADLVGLVIVLSYVFLIREKLRMYAFFTKPNLSFDKGLIQKIIYHSLPLMVQSFFAFGFYSLFFVLIEKLGVKASVQASMAILIVEIAMIIRKPFSLITSSVISNAIGVGATRESILKIAHNIALITTVFTLAVVSVIIAFRYPLIQMFSKNQVSYHETLPIFYAVIITAIAAAPSGIYYKVLVGTGATYLSMLSASVSTFFCHGILAYWLVSKQLPVAYVWSAETLYWVILGIIVFTLLHKRKKLIVRL